MTLIQNHCDGRVGARPVVDSHDATCERCLAEDWQNRLWYFVDCLDGGRLSGSALPRMTLSPTLDSHTSQLQ